eukprot:TRINITY_DN29631_c0_g1_i1.p1 TRINITY_DN29631_c0_g1~~TRINITY_DN29631_c0_g1_i1.p1  ORF type:complete len:147 (-),score=35.54 TRINITY_DN29631_c0_g1_i1:379-819(-)
MLRSLVGSEMCIRDSERLERQNRRREQEEEKAVREVAEADIPPPEDPGPGRSDGALCCAPFRLELARPRSEHYWKLKYDQLQEQIQALNTWHSEIVAGGPISPCPALSPSQAASTLSHKDELEDDKRQPPRRFNPFRCCIGGLSKA